MTMRSTKSMAIWAAACTVCAALAGGAAFAQGSGGSHTQAKPTAQKPAHGAKGHRNDRPAPVNLPDPRKGKADIVPPDRPEDWVPTAGPGAAGGAKATQRK
ncbi:hypothetical protein D3C81_938670 [compost metagenome]|jgi:hypothetical protein|uniref:Uncharacterized protein n=1 Tax=Cupriavidus campinensis TaxID=151783 RepID=A0AAE9L3I4_9BURK|nr:MULTISPECIES: hypothetical protein [Cupriavidus]TSP14517.1 hypothetical protein FGG12_02370 [Cupriavidus campinensis]URF05384.1 hypothetical protein M5D45_06125 [Cupriavidus campinensis]CAG2144579.1 hypothetical protein LMG19282_02601 [Cupriavidus campinensis]